MNIKKSNAIVYLCLMATLALAGCDAAASEKPHEVYNRYYALIIAGRTFDQDKAFYSKARQAEVMAKVRTQANKAGTPIDTLKDLYLKFTKHLADCGELTLLEETIDGKHATLVYSRKETCNTAPAKDGREIIKMIDEDGWKIIDNLTKMSG